MSASVELALHRFGLGARPGDAAKLGDPIKWLAAQTSNVKEPDGFDRFPGPTEIIRNAPERDDLAGDAAARKDYAQKIREGARAAIGARMRAAFVTDMPFHERLVWFWSNHLAVAMAAKLRVVPFVFDYERTAIRPNVIGKFEDLLIASARHPAMLLYLDNATSAGPGSKAGQRRDQGLNENYARELMELHTLGAGSGYTQADIIELAKILSGWTVLPKRFQDRAGTGTAFIFAPQRHEPGRKTLLGVTYDEGEAAGVAAIRMLARHPATAKRLSHKFAAHFTSDTPDPRLVSHLEGVWRNTDGDLGELARGLIAHDAAWTPALTKARDPIQFVTAAVRATAGGSAGQLKPEAELALLGTLRTLGQLPFQAPSPQGWPDTANAWFGPDQVVERAEWALTLASRVTVAIDPVKLAADLFGSLLSGTTRIAISRAPSPQDGLAMLIASPEFMRR